MRAGNYPIYTTFQNDKQNRTGALISNPEMRSFGFGSGWPTKRTPNDLKLDLLDS